MTLYLIQGNNTAQSVHSALLCDTWVSITLMTDAGRRYDNIDDDKTRT